ncbi:RNA-binding protein YlmH, contains S4-like domain [Lentibacillus halodurans]|uniref:RNA-binding protein YlmH, contains S4-like domain n=1 Tax=Lentibacillus halodurans TaxID=237679 RepID=A0A1I0Z0X0_9BACI|nr:RNA-binding protein [Lentibacillus halodurans]SFB19181.1 RNA-binding protein YlmH, contains S4-like domain [Lentibacillus halodurans]
MEIYQHFRKDEHPFIDQTLSWIDHVEKTYQKKVTDFLDPREQQIVDMLTGTSMEELKVHQHGGSNNAERKRVIIAPMYEEMTEADFHLTLMQGSYHEKFVSLGHRDVMGAFLSLGIKRQKLGDILVEDGLIQMIMAEEIAPYVLTNLRAIKKTSIKLEEQPLSSVVEKEVNWVESSQIVSSLRLDTVIKAIYNLSRKNASELVTKGLVKVNYKVTVDPKLVLEAGDMLSLRGKGRSKLIGINGRTKKDNISITTARLK